MKKLFIVILFMFPFYSVLSINKSRMSENYFWKIIDRSRLGVTQEQQCKIRTFELMKLSPKEIIAFDRIFWKLLADAYRTDLWAVAYIINGGCSDDCFVYFRSWLISKGKNYYYKLVKNPKSINEFDEFEAIIYCAGNVYKGKTDKHIPSDKTFKYKLKGKQWKDNGLKKMYPKLCKKYGC